MACYKPLTAFQHLDGGSLIWSEKKDCRQIQIACGQCIGCRLEKSRQWAVRCMHEAKCHRYNSFVTLTYRQETLPENGQLVKRHAAKFMNRLRQAATRQLRKFPPHNPPVGGGGILTSRTTAHRRGAADAPDKALAHRPLIRFYLAGEYGSQFGRPHFHICLFGVDFSDKKYLAKTGSGSKLYRSPTLEKLWTYGFSSVGELTFESAAYAARYIMKKINGKQAEKHYEKLNPDTGEIYRLQPEYNNMSRATGLGKEWMEKHYRDWYPEGKIIVRGKKTNTPRYYDKQYHELDPLGHEQLQHFKQIEGALHYLDQTNERLKVREQVAAAKIQQLKRKLT